MIHHHSMTQRMFRSHKGTKRSNWTCIHPHPKWHFLNESQIIQSIGGHMIAIYYNKLRLHKNYKFLRNVWTVRNQGIYRFHKYTVCASDFITVNKSPVHESYELLSTVWTLGKQGIHRFHNYTVCALDFITVNKSPVHESYELLSTVWTLGKQGIHRFHDYTVCASDFIIVNKAAACTWKIQVAQ